MLPDGIAPDLRRPGVDRCAARCTSTTARRLRASPRRRDGRPGGVHGRPVVQPGPGGAARAGRPNRDALALSGGWWRVPAQVAADARPSARAATRGRSPPEHRGSLRPGQRLLPALPRRDHDLFERRLRAPDQSLADAQRNKYRRMAESAGLERGQHVLEIGTGWGGFALYAAGELGCRVTTVTISRGAARAGRASGSAAAGLEHLVDVQLRDYRDVDGNLRRHRLDRDARGGRRRVPRDVLRGLRPGPSPGRPDEPPVITLPGCRLRATAARRELDPELHLPGRRVPSLAAIERSLARHPPARSAGGAISPTATSGRCGPGGRASWPALDEVRALGFDERFIRMWEYYLAISEAGFATGMTQDLQIVSGEAPRAGLTEVSRSRCHSEVGREFSGARPAPRPRRRPRTSGRGPLVQSSRGISSEDRISMRTTRGAWPAAFADQQRWRRLRSAGLAARN